MTFQNADDSPTPNYVTIVRNSVKIWPRGDRKATSAESAEYLGKMFPDLRTEPIATVGCVGTYHHEVYDGVTLLVILSVFGSEDFSISVANRPKCLGSPRR